MSSQSYLNEAPQVLAKVLCTRQCVAIKHADEAYQQASVAIAIAHHNQTDLLERALRSSIGQTLVKQKKAIIVLLDDNSHICLKEKLGELFLHPALTVLQAECGSPARARNLLLDWVDKQPAFEWVARLDADDELAHPNSVVNGVVAAGNKNSSRSSHW